MLIVEIVSFIVIRITGLIYLGLVYKKRSPRMKNRLTRSPFRVDKDGDIVSLT